MLSLKGKRIRMITRKGSRIPQRTRTRILQLLLTIKMELKRSQSRLKVVKRLRLGKSLRLRASPKKQSRKLSMKKQIKLMQINQSPGPLLQNHKRKTMLLRMSLRKKSIKRKERKRQQWQEINHLNANLTNPSSFDSTNFLLTFEC